jgi:hypothetical protein
MVDHVLGESFGAEQIDRRARPLGPDRFDRFAEESRTELGYPQLVERRADGGEGAFKKGGGSSEDVHESPQFPVSPDERPGFEGLEIERCKIEKCSALRVGIEIDLETAVEEKAVDLIGADASSDSVGSLHYEDLASGFVETDGCGEAGESGPDDEGFDGFGGHGAVARSAAVTA